MAKQLELKKTLKSYGIKNIILSIDSIILIIVIVSAYNIELYLPLKNKLELLKLFSQTAISLSGGILSIVVGALAIILSMMNDKMLKLIYDNDAYYDFMVPYILSAIVWAMNIIISLILFGITFSSLEFLSFNYKIIKFFASVSCGLVISGLYGLIELVFTTLKLGIYRAKIDDLSIRDTKITLEKYNQVKLGMSYNEVKSIVGEGEITSQSSMLNMETIVYTWVNNGGAQMTGTFIEGKLDMKTQFNLK